jgi:hypothetical protein
MRIGLLLCCTSLAVIAGESTPAQSPIQSPIQSLDQAANDPTASLMSVQFQDNYDGAFHNLADESANTFQLRVAAPFKTGDLHHIARATLPFPTHTPSGDSGMGDTTLFDLIVFNELWGRWGVGPVMLIPTATDDALGADKWAIGPALGFTAARPGFIWGLFNQNLFSFAGDDNRSDIRVSVLQPIVNYSLPNKWSIGTSEMNITYDWDRDDWIALPLGVKLAKLMKLGKLPVQFSGSYEYNFQDDFVAPEWTINFTVKLLLPTAFN